MRITTDYRGSQFDEFERKYPERAERLMDYVSDCSTKSIFDKTHDKGDFILSITIPRDAYSNDFGCALFGRVEANEYSERKVIVLDSILF